VVDEWLRSAFFEYVDVEVERRMLGGKITGTRVMFLALACRPSRVELALLASQSRYAMLTGRRRGKKKLTTRRVSAARTQLAWQLHKPRSVRVCELDDFCDLAPELRDQPGPAERHRWSPPIACEGSFTSVRGGVNFGC
jgi:hypothetical protein